MSERTRNIAVGITLMLGLAGVGLMLLVFGQLGTLFERTYPVYIDLPTAQGLTGGSAVRMNGLNIGEIAWVQMLEPPSLGVRVTARIERAYRIPAAAKVHVERKSLLGGSGVLVFDLSGLDAQQLQAYLPQDGSATLAGQKVAAAGDPMQQISRLTDQFAQLSVEWTRLGSHLNQLVEPRQLQSVDAGQAQANLSSMVQRIDQRLSELQPVLENLQQWTGDPEFRRNVRAAAADTAAVMNRLNASLDPLMQRLTAAADNLARTLDALHTLAHQTRQGQGTLGQLMTNPSLYKDLNDAVQQLQALLTDARLLIQKWKAEGVPVQF